jgi:hypothetical protein
MKDTTTRKAADAVRDCLRDIPFLQVKRLKEDVLLGDIQADLVVDLQSQDGAQQKLVIEVKDSGQPRFAREAANHLLRLRNAMPKAYGVFMAPYISQQAADICLKENIGYLDLAGNCRLIFDRVFIRQDGILNPSPQKRDLKSLYAPKSSRILRVLLMRTTDVWRVQALADEAGVSLGQVANVKKLLRDREWITEEDKGFRLTNPQQLLTEWAENYTYRKNIVRDFYSMNETDDMETAIAQECQNLNIPYAFTGFSGARRMAPMVRGQRTMVYVSMIPEPLLERLALKEVPSGANVSLMIPYDEGVYYGARKMDALKIVSPVQLYLDLKSYKGRGEEAAEAIWKQELLKIW